VQSALIVILIVKHAHRQQNVQNATMDSMRMNLNVFLVWRNANYVQITLVVHNVWKKEIFLIQQ
jgi:hypothetical protein